jgi:hypothetical protein
VPYEEPRYQCYKCKEELVFEVKIQRRDTCPNCDTYLHCCRNCRFWDPKAHNECVEDVGEFVRDREDANFCGNFQFRLMDEEPGGEADEAKAKLNRLFGGGAGKPKPTLSSPGELDREAAARARLEALFKK